MERKAQIRKEHLDDRNSLTAEEREELSKKICQNLYEFLMAREIKAGTGKLQKCGVYGYYPHGSEVSLLSLYQKLLKAQIPLAFPRVSGDTMEFFRVTSMEDFSEGAFHIMEPKADCPLAELDRAVCLAPGSVFDKKGNRYGYGKGYYDRYFAIHTRLLRIGVAYGRQIEEEIPTEAADVKMHGLASEDGIFFV